jgi:hypothetical protein
MKKITSLIMLSLFILSMDKNHSVITREDLKIKNIKKIDSLKKEWNTFEKHTGITPPEDIHESMAEFCMKKINEPWGNSYKDSMKKVEFLSKLSSFLISHEKIFAHTSRVDLLRNTYEQFVNVEKNKENAKDIQINIAHYLKENAKGEKRKWSKKLQDLSNNRIPTINLSKNKKVNTSNAELIQKKIDQYLKGNAKDEKREWPKSFNEPYINRIPTINSSKKKKVNTRNVASSSSSKIHKTIRGFGSSSLISSIQLNSHREMPIHDLLPHQLPLKKRWKF